MRFWVNKSVEETRETLQLLPLMCIHPDFPFGHKDLFENLAMQVETLWEMTAQARS